MPSTQARRLRRNSTDAERQLWRALRDRRLAGYKFRRQHPIGPFIADFACVACRVVVEADGGQHAESLSDQRRAVWLEQRGWRVVRFWNNDILGNSEAVIGTLLSVLDQRLPSPYPSPKGRGNAPTHGRATSPVPLAGEGQGEGPLEPN